MSSDKTKSSVQSQQTPAAISRRCLLRHSALVAGGVALTALSARRAQAQGGKMSKANSEYQDTPKDGASCADCTLFVAPSSCAVVEGEVSEAGWCKLYVARA